MHILTQLKTQKTKNDWNFFKELYKVLWEQEMSNSQENLGMIMRGNWLSYILKYGVNFQ